jgi:hypothetical protein
MNIVFRSYLKEINEKCDYVSLITDGKSYTFYEDHISTMILLINSTLTLNYDQNNHFVVKNNKILFENINGIFVLFNNNITCIEEEI